MNQSSTPTLGNARRRVIASPAATRLSAAPIHGDRRRPGAGSASQGVRRAIRGGSRRVHQTQQAQTMISAKLFEPTEVTQ